MLQPIQTFEYDDLDLVQRVTDMESRAEADLSTRFSRRMHLNLPVVSAAMDDITESETAIVMAERGGLGVLHRACTIEEQVEMVLNVKRATNHIVEDLLLLTPGQTIGDALAVLDKYPRVSGLLVVERRQTRKLVGVLSRRDMVGEPTNTRVSELMNAAGRLELITAPSGTSMKDAWPILHSYRIEKLPLVDSRGRVTGLITEKDISKVRKFPNATRDDLGRLGVAAALGVEKNDCFSRAEALVEAGVDVLVIDVAHGGLSRVPKVVAVLVETYPNIDIVAGNVMSSETMLPLIEAGVAGIKAGIAPGYACRTREVTGVGGGQMTVIHECAEAAAEYDVPICADGGIRHFGDIGKGLALGGSTVMIGGMFAGADETPGEIKIREDGRRMKSYRGMASASASRVLKALNQGSEEHETVFATPEGAELDVQAKGPLGDILRDMEGALRSTMSYIGARKVEEMPERAIWRRKARSGQAK